MKTKIKVESVLIANNVCKMKNGEGNALLIGKEYLVKEIDKHNECIIIESEINANHWFPIEGIEEWFDVK